MNAHNSTNSLSDTVGDSKRLYQILPGIILISASLLLGACGNGAGDDHGHDHGPDTHTHGETSHSHDTAPATEVFYGEAAESPQSGTAGSIEDNAHPHPANGHSHDHGHAHDDSHTHDNGDEHHHDH